MHLLCQIYFVENLTSYNIASYLIADSILKQIIYDNEINFRREIELQDAGYPASSPSQIPTYEVVDTSGSVEYEEIDKFQVIEENPVMIEHPNPPSGGYEYTQCPAYAPTQIHLHPHD